MKKWLSILLVVVLALLLPILVAVFWSQPKGTATPPPGPHKAGDVWLASLGGRTTMAMVWCPPGTFMMGSPTTEIGRGEDEIQHEETLTQGFWLGKYEVTQGQWQAIMGNNPSCNPGKENVYWKLWKWWIPVWRQDFLVNRWRLPVEMVSWDDCQEFCREAGLGFRLPTEAEWEYACRAGCTAPYAGSGVLDEMGWYGGNSGRKTYRVGGKKPNGWGLQDMHGNVYEWCQNRHGDYSPAAVANPLGPAAGADRVARGGSWEYDAGYCRAACRFKFMPGCRYSSLGFRVVLAPAVQR